MAKVDYKALCKELSLLGHVVVIDGNDQHGRPLFGVVAVLNHCQVKINGQVYWGLVCVSFATQEVKWYPYNDIMGYLHEGKVRLGGLDRCLSSRYCWMDRMETLQTVEIVQLMVEDMKR